MVQQGEAKLMNEWLALYHPNALQWRRVRLGPLPLVDQQNLYKVTNRWVDAVFFEHNTVFLVEAKLKPNAGAIGQLELYSRLIRETPEFSDYRDKKIKMILLTTFDDKPVKDLCIDKNIDYIVYSPEWLSR
jgi:hypothetical protein